MAFAAGGGAAGGGAPPAALTVGGGGGAARPFSPRGFLGGGGVVVDGLGGGRGRSGRGAAARVIDDGGGGGLDALYLRHVFLAVAAQRGEPCCLAELDLVHVGLGNLGTHGHHVELGQHDDGGRGLEGVQCLALLGDHGHDHAVHGRDDAGVAQVDALGLHLGACLLDLGLQ